MKRFLKALGITGFATLMAIALPATKSAAQVYDDDQYIDYNSDNNGTYQDFYNDLSPYGRWIQDPQYGYVWLPDAGPDFRPYYTNGRWAMTEYGNTWVSDYPWGWAPFHYGRWTYDSYYGWVWIPGSQWGPAWVSWRSNNDYYGWAPLGPGISVSFSFGSGYSCPMDWWVFIPGGYIYNPRFQNYYRGPRYNQNIINNTTIINNTYVNNNSHTTYVIGPRASEIQRITKQPVHVYQIQNTNTRGAATFNNNTVSMFRPQIKQATGGVRPAPQQAVKPEKNIGRPETISSGGGNPTGRTQVLSGRNVQMINNPGVRNNTQQGAPQRSNPDVNRNNNPGNSSPANNNFNGRQPVQQQPQQPQQPRPVQQSQPDRGWQQRSQPVQQQPQQSRPQPVQQQPQQPRPVQQSQPDRSWQQRSQPVQ